MPAEIMDCQPESCVPINATAAGAFATDLYFRPRRERAEQQDDVDLVASRTEHMIDFLGQRTENAGESDYDTSLLASHDREQKTAYTFVDTIARGGKATLWIDFDDLIFIHEGFDKVHFDPKQPHILSGLLGKSELRETARTHLDTVSLLKKLESVPGQVQIRYFVDDVITGKDRKDVQAKEHVLDYYLGLYSGIGLQSGSAVVVRASDHLSRMEALREDVALSGNGRVGPRNNGKLFVTHPWLTRWHALKERDYIPPDLVIPIGGRPTDSQLRAAAFLDRQNDSDIHIVLGGRSDLWKGAGLLLRAAEYTRPDGSLAFSADSIHGLTGHLISDRFWATFKIASLFLGQAQNYRESLRAFSFERLQVEGEEGYLTNYEQKYPQDQHIIRQQMKVEADLALRQHIDPHDSETLFAPGEVVHLCYGANPYPAMLSSIYSQPMEGAVWGWDVSPNVIAYNAQLKQDETYDLQRRQMWHEEIMQAADELRADPAYADLGIGRELFVDVETLTRKQVAVSQRSIEDLPTDTFKRVYMHFGLEATTQSPQIYSKRMRKIAQSLRGYDARLIMVATENSSSLWPGGKRRPFPAHTADLQGFELALLDSGLEIESIKRIDEDIPEDQKVRPGENFVLIVAKLRPK